MAASAGWAIDPMGFEMEMEKQRTRARASWKGAEKRRSFDRNLKVFRGLNSLGAKSEKLQRTSCFPWKLN